MAATDKQSDLKYSSEQRSEEGLVSEVESRSNDKTKKSDRKLFLLILLMLLLISQIAVLLINSSSISGSIEPLTTNQKAVTAGEIKRVEYDLRTVIGDLNELNKESEPKLKEKPVEAEKAEIESVVAPVAPVVTEAVEVNVPPKPAIFKDKKIMPTKKSSPALMTVSNNSTFLQPVATTVVAKKVVEEQTFYIKHDANGDSLADTTEQWSCVLDARNGLMWETKSDNDAIRDSDNLYSWFDPQGKNFQGAPDGGRCKGSVDCDTNSYVQAMNKRNYCGHNDWQLPTREEMLTLVNLESGNDVATIDERYFPDTRPSWYWTSSENSGDDKLAWYVLFRNGFALNDLKKRPKHIRLVRRIIDTSKGDLRVN